MTKKQQSFHASLIKGLHTSKRYQGYYKDEKEEYKELLQEHFGVDTSTKLNINQLKILVDYMNFKDVELPRHKRRDAEFGATCTKAQHEMMKGLWNDFARTPTEEKLLSFLNRKLSKEYKELHQVTKVEAQKMIPVLVTMKENTKKI